MKFLSRNKEILILFSTAFVLRVFLVLTARGIATDGCSYAWFANEIAKGNFREALTYILPPLFPIFTAVASYIFRDIELSGRMVSCIFGSLTVFPLYYLVVTIFDKKIALITVLFFAVHPHLSQASGEVLTEALYFFFLTSIASVCWMAIQKRKAYLFLVVGLLLFLTSLTRSEGFVLIFLVLGWIWLADFPKISAEIRRKLISCFFCLIIFIAALFLYMFFIHQETGKWQIDQRQKQCIGTFVKPIHKEQTPLQRAISLVKYKTFMNIPQIPSCLVKAYHPVFLLLLLFGVIGRKRFKGFKIGEAYILSFVLYRIAILTVVAGINDRYFYAFIPIALCWAGTGFWEIDYSLQNKFKNKNLSIGGSSISRFSILILIAIMAICLPRALRPIRGHRAIQKEIGYWLKENAGQKNFVVISISPQEAFYAGAKRYPLKGNTYTEIINNAREKGADFIIINHNIDEMCPDFIDSVKAEDLEIFTKKFEQAYKNIIIYKLIK